MCYKDAIKTQYHETYPVTTLCRAGFSRWEAWGPRWEAWVQWRIWDFRKGLVIEL